MPEGRECRWRRCAGGTGSTRGVICDRSTGRRGDSGSTRCILSARCSLGNRNASVSCVYCPRHDGGAGRRGRARQEHRAEDWRSA